MKGKSVQSEYSLFQPIISSEMKRIVRQISSNLDKNRAKQEKRQRLIDQMKAQNRATTTARYAGRNPLH